MGKNKKFLFRLTAYIYLTSVAILAFWPFKTAHLCFKKKIIWDKKDEGIVIKPCSAVSSLHLPLNLYRTFKKGKEITIEVKLMTQTNNQGGPSRIVTYSEDKRHRNFTLGQEQDALIFRLRTTRTDLSGITPHIVMPNFFSPGKKQYISVTYDGRNEKIYLDGKLRRSYSTLKGTFANWSPYCNFILGDEYTSMRNWHGRLYLVAIYNRALSGREILHNYLSDFSPKYKRTQKSLVGFYDFSEKSGNFIYDKSPAGLCGTLSKVRYRPFISSLFSNLSTNYFFYDMIMNVVGFLPVSFLIFFNFPPENQKKNIYVKIYILPVFTGFLLSISIEYFQQFLFYRNPNLWDVIYNVGGTIIGAFILHFMVLFNITGSGTENSIKI